MCSNYRARPWPLSPRVPSSVSAFLRLFPGNVLTQGRHLTCFVGDGCENSAAVDLRVFWWYQNRAGLTGLFPNLAGSAFHLGPSLSPPRE